MLHILSHSPWHSDINAMLRILKNKDDLLLIQNGVFGAIKNTWLITIINSTNINISALKEDICARGIAKYISDKVNIVDYYGFINLTIKHTNQINW